MKDVTTTQVKLYLSGPIEVAKQIIRREFMIEGLCVTIEPTLFLYQGGEEAGYVVGIVNYPRFPTYRPQLLERARKLLKALLSETFQRSALLVGPDLTEWYTIEDDLQ